MAGKIVLTCPECGNDFERFPSRVARAKYCSKACRNRGREESVENIFWGHVNIGLENECWEWTASLEDHGYGQFKSKRMGRRYLAHRLAYIFTHGKISEELKVCHKCDNPKCVNPSHLFLGTQLDNVRDMMSKGRGNYVKSKLSREDVLAIRKDRRTAKEIAQSFDISINHVRRIRTGKAWADLG